MTTIYPADGADSLNGVGHLKSRSANVTEDVRSESFSQAGSVVESFSLDEELEDLDPLEFDLPTVDYEPTLDEILREPSPLPGDDTLSSFSDELSSKETSSQGGQKLKKPSPSSGDEAKAEILRCEGLKVISAQIKSAQQKVDSGQPTCIVVDSKGRFAVGTSHSLVLLFDANEVLRASVGRVSDVLDVGPVSSLSCSCDDKKLIAGHSRGLIRLIDAVRCTILLRVTDATSIGHSILQSRWLPLRDRAVCIDSGGSAYQLKFAHGLNAYKCISKCLFSGCKGEACAIEPYYPSGPHQPADSLILIAIATFTKAMVVRLKPNLKVIFALNQVGPADTLPWLAWQSIQSDRSQILQPVLACARDRLVQFFQISYSGTPPVTQIKPWRRISLEYTIMSCSWPSPHSLMLVDRGETLHLMDDSLQEIEATSLAEVQVVYSVADWKGIASGGNVSPAMAYAANYACYQAFCPFKTQGHLFVLGYTGVSRVLSRSWLERINSLVAADDFAAAIRLSLKFYEGRRGSRRKGATEAQSGRWRELVKERTVDLILSFIDAYLGRLSPTQGRIDILVQHHKHLIETVFDASCRLGRHDLVVSGLWDRIQSDPAAVSIFLERLEETLRDDTDGPRMAEFMRPDIVQQLLSHLEQEGLLDSIETVLLRIPVFNLDIHQVMTLCRRHKLYDGVIYVYNSALKDYQTPFQEMLDILRPAVNGISPISDEDIKLGNKALLYLSCCLCGRAYPYGDLSPDDHKLAFGLYSFFSTIHTANAPRDEPSFPFLRTLLKFDAQEFLNVLTMAFQTEEFTSAQGVQKCQRLVDILIQLVQSDSKLTVVEVGNLFSFVARLLVQNTSIEVTKAQIQQLLEGLACAEVSVFSSSFVSRQQALMDLLLSPRGKNLLEPDLLLKLAAEAHFWQVCEFLYAQRRQFAQVLHCYISDPLRKNQVFTFLQMTFGRPDLRKSELSELRSAIVERIAVLSAISPRECGELLVDRMEESIPVAVDKVADQPSSLLDLLGAIWHKRVQKGDEYFVSKKQVNAGIISKYIQLISFLTPKLLKSTLEANPSFCNDGVLKLAKEAGIVDAVTFLLENSGRHMEAFSYRMDLISEYDTIKDRTEEVDDVISVAKRVSTRLSEEERKDIWYPLLDYLLKFRDESKVNGLLQDVINSMLTFTDPSHLMSRLFESSALEWGEMSPLMHSIFVSYEFKQLLYDKTVQVMYSELCSGMKDLQDKLAHSSRGGGTCAVCALGLAEGLLNRRKGIVFSCGHAFHLECLERTASFVRGKHAEKEFVCAKCTGRDGPLHPVVQPAQIPSVSRTYDLSRPRNSSLTMSFLDEISNRRGASTSRRDGVSLLDRPLCTVPRRHI